MLKNCKQREPAWTTGDDCDSRGAADIHGDGSGYHCSSSPQTLLFQHQQEYDGANDDERERREREGVTVAAARKR